MHFDRRVFFRSACCASRSSPSGCRSSPGSGCHVCHLTNATRRHVDPLGGRLSAAITKIRGSAFSCRRKSGTNLKTASRGSCPCCTNTGTSHAPSIHS
jgi:hypothetical protein